MLKQPPLIPGERFSIAAFLAIALTSSFYLLDWHHARSFAQGKAFLDLGLPWESSIPLRSGWIWAYLLYFPVCFTPLLFRELRQDLGIFRKAAFGFAAQFLLAFLSFMLFPARMVRPVFVPTNMSESVLHWFYGIDPGFNIFPSLHVANTAFLACLVGRLGGRLAGAAGWLFCALTAVSALFVKQHYFVDIPAGLVLGAAAYRFAFSASLKVLEYTPTRPPMEDGAKARDSAWTWSGPLRWTSGLAGLGLVIWMVGRIGWEPIRASTAALGWPAIAGLVLLYAPAQFCFLQGWYWTLGRRRKTLGVRPLLLPFLAGDAVNCTIPSANTAGEPIKVAMLRSILPVEDGAASVTVYKFSDFLSLTLFLGFGLTLSWMTLSFPRPWYWAGTVVFLGMAGVSSVILTFQKRGIYGPLLDKLARLSGMPWFLQARRRAQVIDKAITEFYEQYPREFGFSLLFNFLGWFGGALEAYLCLRLMGLPADWKVALAIETFAIFANNLAFFIPARLGVTEGSRILIFDALGFPIASGMAYGIIRRIRELAWIALGYAILSICWPKELDKEAGAAAVSAVSIN